VRGQWANGTLFIIQRWRIQLLIRPSQ
jgi:hypothetical protein